MSHRICVDIYRVHKKRVDMFEPQTVFVSTIVNDYLYQTEQHFVPVNICSFHCSQTWQHAMECHGSVTGSLALFPAISGLAVCSEDQLYKALFDHFPYFLGQSIKNPITYFQMRIWLPCINFLSMIIHCMFSLERVFLKFLHSRVPVHL
jgi:hypothetical protein